MRHAIKAMEFTTRADVRVPVLDIEAIILAGLAVRALARTNPDVSASDVISVLGHAYSGWTAEFIDAVLDYAEREQRFARRFRSWRRRKASASPPP